jgi:hypothetical protein
LVSEVFIFLNVTRAPPKGHLSGLDSLFPAGLFSKGWLNGSVGHLGRCFSADLLLA